MKKTLHKGTDISDWWKTKNSQLMVLEWLVILMGKNEIE